MNATILLQTRRKAAKAIPRIEKTEEVRLSSCPECGSKDITECGKIDEHIQEDILLPRLETTLYRRHHYYCKRCLIHIMRDLKKVNEYWQDNPEVLRYIIRLRKILEDAICLSAAYKNKRWDKAYYKQRAMLEESLKDFSFPNPNKRILKRFAKRLERHKGELLTFLYEKGIDYHNNHAEQQIRPDVIFRKITFGNRSDRGAQYHNVIMAAAIGSRTIAIWLMSILQTAKLNGIDAIRTLEDALMGSRQYPLLTALSPPR